jgi:hypothetical protein
MIPFLESHQKRTLSDSPPGKATIASPPSGMAPGRLERARPLISINTGSCNSGYQDFVRRNGGKQTMAVTVAINGFGRIGRLVLRAIVENGREDIAPVLINDLGSIEANVHLLRYDTVHGRFPGEVQADGDSITLRHQGKVWGPIKVTAEKDPAAMAIRGIDVALECTGRFTKREQAVRLIEAGARKVLVSAPAEGADATIVYGVTRAR